MPSKRKRTADSSSNTTMWNSGRKKSSRKSHSGSMDEAQMEKMFEDVLLTTSDNDEDNSSADAANMEGISNLCETLELDPYDIRVLVLLWKLGATSKPQQISKSEWMEGCAALQVDSMEKLKEKLPALDTGFLDQAEFKDFYKVCTELEARKTFAIAREGDSLIT